MAAEPGFGAAMYPFGNVGAASEHFNNMKEAISRMKEIEDQAAMDATSVEKYMSEMARVTRQAINAVGGMFREEIIRTMVHIAASGATRSAGPMGSAKGLVEHKSPRT